MLERLLPSAVTAVEAFSDLPEGELFPEEQALIARAVDKRRHEFTTGRRCARAALARLGLPARPILSGPNREPLWPPDIVGSITHCTGYRAAAVAPVSVVRTIGVDAEPNAPLPAGVDIAVPAEREWLADFARADPSVCWDRLLFSAKESVYKAWFPLARCWLGFEEATVTVDRAAGAFTAELRPAPERIPGPDVPTRFAGRWLVDRGLVVTAIALAAADSG
jgi:4'-phosphopantetheinyl transferase EntD